MSKVVPNVEYRGIARLDGPLIFIENPRDICLGEFAEIVTDQGEVRYGEVLDLSENVAVLQVFSGTSGLTNCNTRVHFTGTPLLVPVSEEMIGRTFDGRCSPRDNLPPVICGERRAVYGFPINPTEREHPSEFIQTGVSAIDLMNSLVRGQKLPLFSGSGLSHNRAASQIVRQSKLLASETQFTIIFAAMGVKHDVAQFFVDAFRSAASSSEVTLFLSLADDPSVERLLTPRTALTFAEYLAFDLGMHALVILTDMTNYCEALREISSARGEIPSRKGYPGYLYSDLASIFERAGRIINRPGSITQIPILTMPNDDISHPIPDLTGYITEGQIVFDREMVQSGLYPGIGVLPSLSRLMKDGIGQGRTRADHPHLASQLFAAYSNVKNIRALTAVIGEGELSPLDQLYLKFGEFFEQSVLSQGEFENRSIEQSLELGWNALRILPRSELYRLTDEELNKHYDSQNVSSLKAE